MINYSLTYRVKARKLIYRMFIIGLFINLQKKLVEQKLINSDNERDIPFYNSYCAFQHLM